MNNRVKRIEIILFIIVTLFITSLVLIAVFNLLRNPTQTVVVREGKIIKDESQVGYIIRDEVIVEGENSQNGMEQIADENARVANGESIFRYYSINENEIKDKLNEIDAQFETAMSENVETIFSSDTKLLDVQISEKLKKLNTLTSTQEIQEYKKEIDNYIKKKARIVAELSPEGSTLKDLINQRDELENSLVEGSEYIKAPVSGIVSYRVDNLETVLTSADFSIYNEEYLNNLNLKAGQIVDVSTEKGKIINNFKCYIAFTSDTEEAKNAAVGDKLTLELPSATQINAKIIAINPNGENSDKRTIIVEFDKGIKELTVYRKIPLEIIWWNSTGYKIPDTALIKEDNLDYIIKEKNDELVKVLVKVKKQAGGYAIIRNYSTSELEKLDESYKTTYSVANYDEIILDPTEEQIYKAKRQIATNKNIENHK